MVLREWMPCDECMHMRKGAGRKLPDERLEKLLPKVRVANFMASTCDAYPTGIPEEILVGRVDHRQPYDGDNGIQFELDPWDTEDAEGVNRRIDAYVKRANTPEGIAEGARRLERRERMQQGVKEARKQLPKLRDLQRRKMGPV